MDWIETPESSNIEQYAYDETDSSLHVMFNGGSVYRYADVPEALFAEMRLAPSTGRFLNQNLKGAYLAERIG